MTYLIIAILCSVSVSVLLKILRRKNIDIRQTIVAGYPVAFLLTFVFLQPDVTGVSDLGSAWSIILLLGILLPLVFVILGYAIESAGLIVTDAAQRLSLIIPIIAAFALFGETLTPHRQTGIGLGFLALITLAYRRSVRAKAAVGIESDAHSLLKTHLPSNMATRLPAVFWLLGVWMGYGIIDILFKQVAKQGAAFALTLFMSFGIAAVILFAYLVLQKTKWQPKALIAGLLLGVLNMGNIYAYIKAHQTFADSPSVVFTGMNVGVIAVATIVGVFAFKETLSKVNMLGIVLAIGCVMALFWESITKLMA